MFGFFKRKKEVEKLRDDVHKSFNAVKEDFTKVGQWITHIDGKHKAHTGEISNLKEMIFQMQDEINEIKRAFSFNNPGLFKQLSKQKQTAVDKQTAVGVVQTPVQTAVQTTFFTNLTVMERGILWALLNSEMKLSHEDIAALLGKEKSTIRGQINSIKQKSEGLICEMREKNGKKRLFIPDDMKEQLLKNVKVRVKSNKKLKKNEG